MSKAEDLVLLKQEKQTFAENISKLIQCGKFSKCSCTKTIDKNLLDAFYHIVAADYSVTTINDEQLSLNVQAANVLLTSLNNN